MKCYFPLAYKCKVFSVLGWITVLGSLSDCLLWESAMDRWVEYFPPCLRGGRQLLPQGGRKVCFKILCQVCWATRLTFSFLGTNSFLIMTSISETSLLLTNMKNRCKVTCAWSDICCAFIPLAHLVSFVSFANSSVFFIRGKLKFQAVGSLPEWIFHLCSFLWWRFWTKRIYDNTPD